MQFVLTVLGTTWVGVVSHMENMAVLILCLAVIGAALVVAIRPRSEPSPLFSTPLPLATVVAVSCAAFLLTTAGYFVMVAHLNSWQGGTMVIGHMLKRIVMVTTLLTVTSKELSGQSRSQGRRRGLVTVVLASATVAAANLYVSQFEVAASTRLLADWDQTGLYPLVLSVFGAFGFGIAARAFHRPGGATLAAAIYWCFRALLTWGIDARGGSVSLSAPPLALLPAAMALDTVIGVFGSGRTARFSGELVSAGFATLVFVLYRPLSALVPSTPVSADQLVFWMPVAVVTAGAAGYLGDWLRPAAPPSSFK